MTGMAFDQAFRIGMGETPVRFPTPLDRLIYLRTLPNLGGLAGNGLSYIATQARERQFTTGELLYRPEEPIDVVHFVVEGRVRVEQEGLHLLDALPTFTIGFLPVLAGSRIGQTATALEPTVTLEIVATDLLEIFEDDFGFLENGIRQLSRQLLEAQSELEVRGLLTRSEPEATPYPHERLDLVERLALIRKGPYADVNLEPLVQLVSQAEELRVEPGTVLWEQGDPSTWGLHVAHGVIHCSNDERSFRMGPGSMLGYLDANGQLPRAYRAVAETKVVLMKEPTETFFDVLEDNFTLAIGVLSFFSQGLLQLTARVAKARQDDQPSSERGLESDPR